MRAPLDDDVTTIMLQRLVVGVLLIATTVWLGIQVVVEADVNVDEWWNVFVDRFAFLDGVALAMNSSAADGSPPSSSRSRASRCCCSGVVRAARCSWSSRPWEASRSCSC